MNTIHMARVVIGGLVAGLVMNAIDFVVNAVWLAPAWNQSTKALGIDVASIQAGSAIGWITSDFLAGILLVFIYAGIRPRFGPGPKTAVIASLIIFAALHIAYASFVFMGLYPLSLCVQSALGGLVAELAGGQIGCRLYQEQGAPQAARVLRS